MTPAAVAWLRAQVMSVRPEYATPFGICDLVAVSVDPVRLQQRLSLRQRVPVRDPRKLALLQHLPLSRTDRVGGELKTPLEDLTKAGYSPEETEWLLRHGYIAGDAQTGYERRTAWAPLDARIVAVELKLERAPEALRQAARNRTFATESYVGLPYDRAEALAASSRSELFVSKGVGLLAIGADSCDILIPAAYSPEQTNWILRALCVERFWPDLSRASRA